MKVRILGSAAGGGLPQWNCGCASCATARERGVARTQDCLAVSADGHAWYAVNASPDLRTQLLAAPELAPAPGTRETPLRGVLLSSGELDHTLGLLMLREAAGLTVHVTAPVREALASAFPVGPILAPYAAAEWRTVEPGLGFSLAGGLQVTAVPLSAKRPRYAADLPEHPAWTVAYRFTDPASGGTLLYAPCLAEWTPTFEAALAGADVVILDGTFWDDGEMSRGSGAARTSRGMGHLAIVDSLPLIAARPGPRYLYTHLNNTNPLAHADAPARRQLAEAGAEIAEDGLLISL